MSPENVELTRAAYAAFRRRDYDRLLVLLHAEVEFSSLIMDADSRVFRGHAGVREYLDSLLEVLPECGDVRKHSQIPAVERVDGPLDELHILVTAATRNSPLVAT